MREKNAFTLAEVLITLGIIGVVAAMTMPVLIQKHQEKTTMIKLQKAYSILQQAYMHAIADNGPIEEWNIPKSDEREYNAQAADAVVSYLKPYFKIIKDCGHEKGCFYDGYYKGLNGSNYFKMYNTENPGRYMITIGDGSSIAFWADGYVDGQLGIALYYDINGEKAPNVAGKDLFQFQYTDNKIVPAGTSESIRSRNGNCYALGLACTLWIFTYHNMDYLHCDDLEYDVKIKCKQ